MAVLNEIRSALLQDNNLENLLDSKYHILGFNDGVFDFHEMRFRPVVQSDYVSTFATLF